MPEKTKQEKDIDPEKGEPSGESEENRDPSTWEEDQKRRGYYYDDACGYEVYQPGDEEESE